MDDSDDLDDRIRLIEERLSVGKRVVDRGGVRVSTRTETHIETAQVTLEDTNVEVEHVPAGRFVDAAVGPVVDGELTILPVYEERIVVEKRLWLVEEIHIRQRRVAREVEIPTELRRQVAVVERLEPDDLQTINI